MVTKNSLSLMSVFLQRFDLWEKETDQLYKFS